MTCAISMLKNIFQLHTNMQTCDKSRHMVPYDRKVLDYGG